MYTSLGRRRGFQSAAGVLFRSDIRVEAHKGSPRVYLGRMEYAARTATQGNAEAKQNYFDKVFFWASDERNLFCAWKHLEAGDGKAPGIDGFTYSDMPPECLWEYLRSLRDALRDETYEPMPLLGREIPKASGQGTRTLELASIIDRVVGRAIVQAIQPFLDPAFDDYAFGYRPHRGSLQALATVGAITSINDKWVLLTEDIHDAFGQIPRERLGNVIRLHIGNEKLVRVIEKLAARDNRRGIPQGQPLSPLLLNIYLDHFLDRPWRRTHSNQPLIRVADDIAVVCHTREEAEAAYGDLQELLRPAGMPLKGNRATAIHDLDKGESVEWLGFRLSKGVHGIQADLTQRAWERLEDALELCHSKRNAPIRAQKVILGWVGQMGPGFRLQYVEQDIKRIRRLAVLYGFEEIPSGENLLRQCELAYLRWQRLNAVALENDEHTVPMVKQSAVAPPAASDLL
jgi:retron-type reverse transcriptase